MQILSQLSSFFLHESFIYKQRIVLVLAETVKEGHIRVKFVINWSIKQLIVTGLIN